MKIGIGLYKHQLDDRHFQFARQCGCTHIVAHMVDYFHLAKGNHPGDQPVGDRHGWGRAGDPDRLWSASELIELRKRVEDHGLILEAIENFDPAHWHDILLDGPLKKQHLDNIKKIIKALGEAGIPIMGYNFSIAGVAGRIKGTFARGGAEAVGMDGPCDDPLPIGMAWNMIIDAHAPEGCVPSISHDELWRRVESFLAEVLPVAEAAGVVLAAHPDDPPMPWVRGQPRLVYQPHMFQRLVDLHTSPNNKLELCIGTIAEMTEGDVYQVTRHHARNQSIGYIHLRNVHGKVPFYQETFIDDGEIDILRILKILHEENYQGIIIPDHAPQMSCDAPWHAGMAYALGYLTAGIGALKSSQKSS